MITSKLSSKAQTTIPRAVRAALRLEEGDEIAYQIDGDRVIVTRAGAVSLISEEKGLSELVLTDRVLGPATDLLRSDETTRDEKWRHPRHRLVAGGRITLSRGVGHFRSC